MITVALTAVGLALMYVVCIRPMCRSDRGSCCSADTDERIADMQRQVEALRGDPNRAHAA